MIFAFVIDSSASMNQRTSNGMSLLDCSKAAVEHFLKVRGRDPNAMRNDRYLLFSYGDGLSGVHAGWND
eukprot:CAMPEP_0177684914 /NCGR_PEP_ID=MMETSP0447-20121125/32688_1 /TAXON_ID=0 /ORGANISM="Stygamoeba regulata, Strain BSH-02190019" /LENGTH=68 /DNA_ID=CAMNT_0019194799 /DNA_START=40 /DNA_END=243 /DNA_ORIENTATION=-